MKFNEIMKAKGFTINSLAEIANVNARTIEQYSSGRCNLRNCRAYIVIALAEALEVHPKELIDEPSE